MKGARGRCHQREAVLKFESGETMANDKYGGNYESMGPAVAVGTILLLSHLVGIQPSDVSVFGLKFTISDPAIVNGAIAILFMHYFLGVMSTSEIQSKRQARAMHLSDIRQSCIQAYRMGSGRVPRKKLIKGIYTYRHTLLVMHASIIAIIVSVALVFSVLDIGRFIIIMFNYIYNK